MKSIKVACFNNINYCKFPEGIDNIKDFVGFLNQRYNSFVELEMLVENSCVAPHFIEGKTEKQYWNPLLIRCIKESEVYLYTQDEYDEKLKEVIACKCVHCVNYSEDVCEQDFESHREHISLDGECYGFEKKKNDNERDT